MGGGNEPSLQQQQQQRRPQLCWYWHERGSCKHGDQCLFVHGERSSSLEVRKGLFAVDGGGAFFIASALRDGATVEETAWQCMRSRVLGKHACLGLPGLP